MPAVGNNKVFGGAGDDNIVVGKGNDIVDGGAGTDTLDYSADRGARDGVNINLKDADEGTGKLQGVAFFRRIFDRNEKDTITNIEDLTGTNVRDILSGNSAANRLYGEGGNDALYGEAGADSLLGGSGNDLIHGGTGDYTLNNDGNIVYQATTSGATGHTYEYAVVLGEEATMG